MNPLVLIFGFSDESPFIAELVSPAVSTVRPVQAVRLVASTDRTGSSRSCNLAFAYIGFRISKYFFIIYQPDACLAIAIACPFSSLGIYLITNSLKEEIISRYLSIYAFKYPLYHQHTSNTCCTIRSESPKASTRFTPVDCKNSKPNKRASYST